MTIKNFFMILCLSAQSLSAEQAVVIVPIANMIGEPAGSLVENIKYFYEHLPICWGPDNRDKIICPRIHQLLFNEVVEVIEKRGKEVLVELPQVALDGKHGLQPAQFWTLKKYLLPLRTLKHLAQGIPDSLRYPLMQRQSDTIVTLKLPFYDRQSEQTYSAGTRFVNIDEVGNYYRVYIFDALEQQLKETFIPKTLCINNRRLTSSENRRKEFVKLLQLWATMPEGAVPFCWGGISLQKFYSAFSFVLKSTHMPSGERVHYWKINNASTPYSGFDMSGLVLRAAQICSIPYFYKNTTTASHHLSVIERSKDIREGDIIWIPGGMFVITNIENNQIVGALNYKNGYGCVRQVSLSSVFKGINTLKDLMKAYYDQKPLVMKDKDGAIIRTVNEFKLLSLY